MGNLFIEQYDPDATEKNSRAQNSNPMTEVVPTPAKTETAPADPLKTNAPDNAGIVPVPKGGVQEINKQLYSAAIPGGYDTKAQETMGAYGLNQKGIPQEQGTEIFGGAPDVKVDESGKIFRKQISNITLDTKGDVGLSSLKNDLNLVDLSRKQPNSGIGLDINLGPSAEDTLKMAEDFMNLRGKKNSPIDNTINRTSGDSQKFVDAFAKIQSALDSATDRNDPNIQSALADLKIAMYPMVHSAYATGSMNMESTAVLDKYQQYMKSVDRFKGFYAQGADGIKDMAKSVDEYSSRKLISYVELKDTPSYHAKQGLNSSPIYQDFLDNIAKNNPEMAQKINVFRNSSIVSEEEKKFIDDVFFGPSGYKNLKEARAAAFASMDVFKASAMFKPFDDIMNIKDLRYETGETDYLTNLKTTGGYQSVGPQSGFQLDSGSMPVWQSSGQTKTGAYTTPVGGYGTVTHGSNG